MDVGSGTGRNNTGCSGVDCGSKRGRRSGGIVNRPDGVLRGVLDDDVDPAVVVIRSNWDARLNRPRKKLECADR